MLSRVQRAFVRLVRPLSESRPQSAAGSEQERTSRASLKVVPSPSPSPSPDDPAPEHGKDSSHLPADDGTEPQSSLPQAASDPTPSVPLSDDTAAQPNAQGAAPLSRGSTEWWMAMVKSNERKQEELRLERGKRQYQSGTRSSRRGFRFTAGTLLNRKAE